MIPRIKSENRFINKCCNRTRLLFFTLKIKFILNAVIIIIIVVVNLDNFKRAFMIHPRQQTH